MDGACAGEGAILVMSKPPHSFSVPPTIRIMTAGIIAHNILLLLSLLYFYEYV
jgi:hypothetical protein